MSAPKLPDDLAKIRDDLAEKFSPTAFSSMREINILKHSAFHAGFDACAEIMLKREAELRDRFENADEFAKRYAQATGELRGDNEYLKKQNIKLQDRVSRLTEAIKELGDARIEWWPDDLSRWADKTLAEEEQGK